MAAPRWKARQGPWSIKRHLQTLGILAITTLALAIMLGIQVLGHTESAVVDEAVRQMDHLQGQLVARYEYMRGTVPNVESENLDLWGGEELLRSVVQSALTKAEGVEGGFYRLRDRQFLGYAYPTYHGSGTKNDIPRTERPAIQRVINHAIQQERVQAEQVVSGPDILLFRAEPLLKAGQPVGAIWLLHRLRGIHNVDRQLYGVGLLGILGIVSAVAVSAWVITRRLDRGVSGLESGLRRMEDQLDAPLPMVNIQELDRIGTKINRLAHIIQEQHGHQSILQGQLHEAERLAILGRLVAGVAHEIRNPLASIRLRLQLTRRNASDPASLQKALDVMEEETTRLDRLVVRLLSLSKPAEIARLPTDLFRFLADRVDSWQSLTTTRNVTIRLLPESAPLHSVFIDQDRLGQIVDNLVANAIDALAPDGGSITIEILERDASELTIVVTDTGPGIPPDTVSRLFEPFFTTKTEGTGLGLFLSAEMARAMGGHLHYVQRPEGGARFELHLPC